MDAQGTKALPHRKAFGTMLIGMPAGQRASAPVRHALQRGAMPVVCIKKDGS
ncbi:hypothetical protein [Rhizobium giardinii]|uniref:hypothetical protein n=1 Tax=Rhizobium giardinii TaxID=56731 RepID=UPI0039E17B9F